MRHALTIALAAATLAACGETGEVSGPDVAASSEIAAHRGYGPAGAATYELTVINEATGLQPLTPPLAATHRKPISMFTVGEAASHALEQIAENGNLAPMYDWLTSEHHVSDVEVAGGPVLPGAEATLVIEAERGAKYLSFVSMLVCTNDGFTGVDGLRLPAKVGDVVTVHTDGYDAGTEPNTEAADDLVGGCPAGTGVNNEPVEDEVIRHHPGIQGGAALDPATYGWDDPVATVIVTRIQ